MNQSLFNITLERRQIMEALEASDGEATPELAEALAVNREDFEAKAESYAIIMRKLETEQDAIDSEISRLTALKKSKVNQYARLEENLLTAVLLYGEEGKNGNKFYEVGTFRFRTQRNPKSVELTDESLIPDEFKVQKITYTVSKTTIKNALELGQEVPGAQMKEGDVRLVMK